jgi:uncharacterized membrane protein YkvA (DUF1232 family)
MMASEPEQPKTNALSRIVTYLPFREQLIGMGFAVLDRRTPMWVKATVVGALTYLVMPFDVIPDWLLVLGYTEDVGGLLIALKTLASHTTDEHKRQAREWIEKNTR